MASASTRFLMKDADAVTDADADQCKRTFSLKELFEQTAESHVVWDAMARDVT